MKAAGSLIKQMVHEEFIMSTSSTKCHFLYIGVLSLVEGNVIEFKFSSQLIK